MSDTLIVDQKVVADSILADYSFIGNGDPSFMERDAFITASPSDQKMFLESFIPNADMVKLLTDNLKSDEMFDLLSTVELKEATKHIVTVLKAQSALLSAVTKAENFIKKAGAPSTTPTSTANDYLTQADVDKWKNGTTTPIIKVVDSTSDKYETIYKLDPDNEKSLFLCLLLAAPELLNQLILKKSFSDSDSEVKQGLANTETIDKYKAEFKEALNNAAVSDDQLLDLLAVLAFLCFGKLIHENADAIDMAGIVASDTRICFASTILEIAGIGIIINDEVAGRANNVIKGVKIVMTDTDFDVVCDKVFVKRHTHYEEYDGWLPSAFYSKYNNHGIEISTPKYKNVKDFWQRVVFEAYTTTMSSKNTVRYIVSRIR